MWNQCWHPEGCDEPQTEYGLYCPQHMTQTGTQAKAEAMAGRKQLAPIFRRNT